MTAQKCCWRTTVKWSHRYDPKVKEIFRFFSSLLSFFIKLQVNWKLKTSVYSLNSGLVCIIQTFLITWSHGVSWCMYPTIVVNIQCVYLKLLFSEKWQEINPSVKKPKIKLMLKSRAMKYNCMVSLLFYPPRCRHPDQYLMIWFSIEDRRYRQGVKEWGLYFRTSPIQSITGKVSQFICY